MTALMLSARMAFRPARGLDRLKNTQKFWAGWGLQALTQKGYTSLAKFGSKDKVPERELKFLEFQNETDMVTHRGWGWRNNKIGWNSLFR